VKQISESASEMYETDSEIRFTKKKKNLWNGFQNPFQKCMKRIPKSVLQKKNCETDFGIHFKKVWNGFQIPFQKSMKSVSRKKIKICEMDFGIRFILFWNGFWNPFHKKKLKFVKRISKSVSEKYETDSEIHF